MKREKEANPKSENLLAVNLDLEIEELEPIAAPSLISNSNETLISDPEE